MKKILLIMISVLFVLSLTACITPKYYETDSPLIQEDEDYGIKIKCSFIDHETIVERHGFKHNPFLPPPMVVTPQPILVYEFTIKNLEEAPIKLDIRDVNFYFNGKSYRPVSKVQIEDKINEFGDSGMDKGRQRRTAKRFMLGDIRVIDGMSEVKGYLLFMGSFREKGETEMNVPFRTINNLEAGDFTFYYDFIKK